jgi:VWFA-related protein
VTARMGGAHRRDARARLALAGALPLLMLCPWAAADGLHALQEPPAAPPPAAVVDDAVEVRVVDVDVVVVDRQGRPVTGLTRDDFELLEDGEPVPIDYFSTGARSRGGAGDGEAAAAPEVPRASATAAGSDRAASPTTVVLYLDDFDLHPAHRARVLADLEQALPSWRAAADRFLLARYGRRLELVAGPTADLDAILGALSADDRNRDARGLDAELAIRQAERAIVGSYQACESVPFCAVCFDNWDQMVSYAADYAREEELRTAIAIAGLADLTGVLAGLPGRKVVLYVGDGFQQRPGAAMFGYVADVCADIRGDGIREVTMEALQFDESRRYTELAAHAAAARVTFYMLDAAGVRASSAASVEHADRRFTPTSENDFLRTENLQSTHFVIANETGGKAILNASRPRADLERLAAEVAHSYSLGFTPRHPPTGRVHLLEVRLVGAAAKGRTARYRRSYRDKQLEARLADDLVAALFLGESGNPHGIGVRLGDTVRLDRRRHELPVGVFLPGGASPAGLADGHTVRVWMTAVADDGRRTGIRQKLIELGPGGVEAEGGVYTLVVDVELPEGEHTLAVGVRDESTGIASFQRVRASVPAVSGPAPD